MHTLQASNTNASTDGTSVSSSSSSIIDLQIASQSSKIVPLKQRTPNRILKPISKSIMHEKGLSFVLWNSIAKFLPDQAVKIIFDPEIPSLDKWIEVSKSLNLPSMFRENLGKK